MNKVYIIYKDIINPSTVPGINKVIESTIVYITMHEDTAAKTLKELNSPSKCNPCAIAYRIKEYELNRYL